ncbi:hypothetical protein ACXYMU_04960 [Pontibacter sp. CAU 1760]
MKYIFRLLLPLVFAIGFQTMPLAQGAMGNTWPKEHLEKLSQQIVVPSIAENPLFAQEEVLRFTINSTFKALLKDRDEDSAYHPASLVYRDAAGQDVRVNLKIRVRGNHRRDPRVCRFPPILLNFSRKTSQQTIFKHVNKVKLVTHCLDEEYVFREYLVYKLYNLFTDMSFRVRLCQVTYQDVEDGRRTEVRYAFMIEDDEEMADRNKATIVPDELIIGMEGTDQKHMALLAIFQYMIGNTDWSVPYRHNIKLLSVNPLRPPVPVPYDFDYCGLVGPPYAVPPPELGITSVRDRLYRGYDSPTHVYAEVVQGFNAQRTAVFRLYEDFPLINKSTQKQTIKFLEDFYGIINDPKDFRRSIVQVAQKNQHNYVNISGLK